MREPSQDHLCIARSTWQSEQAALFGDLSGGATEVPVVRSEGALSTMEVVDNPVDEFGEFVRKPYFTT
jgi:hypothetical protein